MTGRTPATRNRKNAENQAGTQEGNGNPSEAQPTARMPSKAHTESSQAVPPTQEHHRQEDQYSGESQSHPQSDIPCPPEEGPTLRQILFMMVQQNAAAQRHTGQHSKLIEFQRTSPPVFTQSNEPLEADDWLRTIE